MEIVLVGFIRYKLKDYDSDGYIVYVSENRSGFFFIVFVVIDFRIRFWVKSLREKKK